LKKALYGLVQAAQQWWKKITDALSTIGLKPTEADPCLFVKKRQGSKPPACIILYVDDGGIFGTPEDFQTVLNASSTVLKVKAMGKWNTLLDVILLKVRINALSGSITQSFLSIRRRNLRI
jgi:Reverse transcriptase (RNA-dependent DNA polymerase)